MLSYRHSFHAGNFADLIKHSVLVDILEHLILKEKPFEYIDTHAGAGLYDLRSENSQKLEEHTNGIGMLDFEIFPELAGYFAAIHSYNDSGGLNFYPGSPALAKYFMRTQDRAWLFELHPQDHQLLHENMSDRQSFRVHFQDGFEGLNSLLPPNSRRGLVLIDPSYEIKSDYDLTINNLIKAYKKFNNGIFAIWYPVVERNRIDKIEDQLKNSGIKNIQRFELGLAADSLERGMTSSGMIVINPPWKLFEKMNTLLPKLAQAIGDKPGCFYKCDVLAKE